MSAESSNNATGQIRYLTDMKDGEAAVIRANGDRKSTEMGLFPQARVVMFRNRKSEQSLVIGADDARFLISRAIAKKVEIET